MAKWGWSQGISLRKEEETGGKMKVPLLDLKAQYASIREELDRAVAEVVASQQFILGPQVAECERAVASYCGCAYGVGVSSGTDALLLALMAERIGPGDEVITTPYTFFATAGSIARAGAKPVFVDIEPESFNIAPDRIEERISDRTRAIIPVHLYGRMADMKAIMAVASAHNLTTIEDAAQAIGAETCGMRACSVGHYGCLSFFPSKNLGGFGDGGMVLTSDEHRRDRLVMLRVHGSKRKYCHEEVGGNFRFDTLQAAVILAKLRHLDRWTEARRANAARYARLFEHAGLAGTVKLPEPGEGRHVFNQYVIRAPRRDELMDFLRKNEIGCEIYYPVPLHLQKCFAYLGHRPGDFPNSEKAAAETLALPVYPELSDAQAEHVVATIRRFYCG